MYPRGASPLNDARNCARESSSYRSRILLPQLELEFSHELAITMVEVQITHLGDKHLLGQFHSLVWGSIYGVGQKKLEIHI